MRPYYRLSGGGNDFLALLQPPTQPTSEEIRALCRRGLSAGADGLFILERSAEGARMHYFNADGKAAALCLNGTRCAVRLACHVGWAAEATTIETGRGKISGRLVDENRVALALAPPELTRQRSLELADIEYSGWEVRIGVPHFVLPWASTLTTAPVCELGSRLRSHVEWGSEGSNVHFVRYTGRHRLEIRSYERGVEAETLACGTGVMAAAAAGIAQGALALPVDALTLGGFELEVEEMPSTASGELWSLTGDARLIADGTLHEGAFMVPSPPRWT